MNTAAKPASFTPGPLVVVAGQCQSVMNFWAIVQRSDDGSTAMPTAYVAEPDDAQLYAASPRLLNALIGACRGWDRWYSQLPIRAEDTEFAEFMEARRAIAEALGLTDWRQAFPEYLATAATDQAEGAQS